MKNPFLSLWLSQAYACAGMVRGFWAAEMRRRQGAAAKAMRGRAGAGKGKVKPRKGRRAGS